VPFARGEVLIRSQVAITAEFLPDPSDAAAYAKMEAGVADHAWSIEEIVGLLD
jgi:hypothetical protein